MQNVKEVYFPFNIYSRVTIPTRFKLTGVA